MLEQFTIGGPQKFCPGSSVISSLYCMCLALGSVSEGFCTNSLQMMHRPLDAEAAVSGVPDCECSGWPLIDFT